MQDELKADLKRRMTSSCDVFSKELQGLRTGRASPQLLEPVLVEAYGAKTPLNQVGNIQILEPRLLGVQVWDQGLVKAVEKAIRESGLGLNPSSDGALVRVPLPDLTADRRKELVKLAHKYAEDTRVAIRSVRRDGMDMIKKLEKDKKISEDESRHISEDIQKLTDSFVQQIDALLTTKEKDILAV